MVEFSPAAKDQILSISPRDSYKGYTIPASLAILRKYVSEKSRNATSRPHLKLSPVLRTLRDNEFLATLLADCEEWLKFYYFSSIYRASLYADEVVTGFNNRALLRVPLATRALFELFLYTYHVYNTLYQRHKEVKAVAPHKAHDAIAITIKERDFLMKQAAATRVNWDDPFGAAWHRVRDDIRQTNILSVVQKLPLAQREKVERWYALLSDACHPNYGSTLFVLDHDQVTTDLQPLFAFTRSTGPSHLQLVVDLVTAPLGFACDQLVRFLGVLERVLAMYRDGVVRFQDP